MFLIVGVALIGAVGYGLRHRPSPVIFNFLPPMPTPLPTATPTNAPVRVHITGAAHKPGVYTLPPWSTVSDAIQVAGGPTQDADLEQLNLAAEIQDQQQIIVPRQRVFPTPTADGLFETSDSSGESDIDLVNVNTADKEALTTLPGIGPVLADRIIAYREANGPFATVEDVANVKGIGPKTLEKLRPLVTVGP